MVEVVCLDDRRSPRVCAHASKGVRKATPRATEYGGPAWPLCGREQVGRQRSVGIYGPQVCEPRVCDLRSEGRTSVGCKAASCPSACCMPVGCRSVSSKLQLASLQLASLWAAQHSRPLHVGGLRRCKLQKQPSASCAPTCRKSASRKPVGCKSASCTFAPAHQCDVRLLLFVCGQILQAAKESARSPSVSCKQGVSLRAASV